MAKLNDDNNSKVHIDLTLAKEGSVIIDTHNDDDLSLAKF
jgi:hypothetical protein